MCLCLLRPFSCVLMTTNRLKQVNATFDKDQRHCIDYTRALLIACAGLETKLRHLKVVCFEHLKAQLVPCSAWI